MIKQKQKFKLPQKYLFYSIDFIIGFMLSRSIIFFSVLPLGISYGVASIHSKRHNFGALGAFLGYLLLNDAQYKYAGITLILTALLNISAINHYIMSACCVFFVSTVHAIFQGFSAMSLFTIISETIICTSSIFLYITFFKKDSRFEKPCTLFFLVTIVSSLTHLTIFYGLSPIRIFCSFLVLACTYFGKSGTGCIVGVILGIAMDNNIPIFTVGYSFASIISGVFCNMSKSIFCSVFLVMYTISCIFDLSSQLFLPSLYEVFIACIIFILLPTKKLQFIKTFLQEKPVFKHEEKFQLITSEASSILTCMSDTLINSVETIPCISYGDINKLYIKTTNSLCKSCNLSNICWGKDYISSIDALNSATINVIKRGHFLSTDFPYHFSTRCIDFSNFLNSLNDGICSITQNNQQNKMLEDNKTAIANQCKAISSILQEMTISISDPIENFPYLQDSIEEYLQIFLISCRVLVYNNSSNLFFVDIYTKNTYEVTNNLKRICKKISQILGKNISFISQVIENNNSVITFRENYRFKLDIDVKNISKHATSGDVVSNFIVENGLHYIILSDGMGSGAIANKESLQVISILERILKASVSLHKALKGVAPLASIKNNDKNFSALDLLSIDLTTLEGVIAKYGAVSTYLLRNKKVHKISSNNLPLGLSLNADISRIKFANNDIIVMMSDGINALDEDAWLINLLQTNSHLSCHSLNDEILNNENNLTDDDKTIITIKISTNN